MMPQTSGPQPPRIASWVIDLFAFPDDAESILGDLHEEFLDRAAKSEVASARRWYRRQSARTIAHLAVGAIRLGPWWFAATVLLGFLLSWFGAGLPEQLVVALLRTQRPYSNLHVEAYMRFVTYGIPMAIVTQALLIGCIVAVLARGREVIATITLSFICATPLVFLLLMMQTTPYPRLVPGFGPYLLLRAEEFFAMIIAGVIVHKFRSRAAHRLATG
jgi:hypothetical protein